jgi:hypothetical protein
MTVQFWPAVDQLHTAFFFRASFTPGIPEAHLAQFMYWCWQLVTVQFWLLADPSAKLSRASLRPTSIHKCRIAPVHVRVLVTQCGSGSPDGSYAFFSRCFTRPPV